MAKYIESPRNYCALHGALQTIQAVAGLAPILHSTAGCAVQNYLGNGCQSLGNQSGTAIAASNLLEKHIVFGGASRLREQIKNTVKVNQADLYVVLSGCAPELVGDDVPAMVKEAQEQGAPVFYITAPGFKGDVHDGYAAAVKGIVRQLFPEPEHRTERIPGFINIFGILPGQDVFWQGDLQRIEKLLQAVGLTANTLLGMGKTIEDWKNIPKAQLNLVFSPGGRRIATYLQEKFGTPYLEVDDWPVGADLVKCFLQSLRDYVKISDRDLVEFYEWGKKREEYYLCRLADIYFAKNAQQAVAVVGESGFVQGINFFLTNTLGMIPQTLIFTDPLTKEEQRTLKEKLFSLYAAFDTNVFFAEDQREIADVINGQQKKIGLLLGSSLERITAEDRRISFMPISFPLKDAIIFNKSYLGFEGAITFIEDVFRVIIKNS